jgi:cysteine desulfurase
MLRNALIYFDHNATSPVLPEARRAWLEACDRFPGNPSSPHRLGSRAEAALSEARARLATILACDPMDIVWTSGATESNNMVLYNAAAAGSPGREVWVSSIEHPSILEPCRALLPDACRLIPVRPSGVVDVEWLTENLARTRPALVIALAANNETGVIQPWKAVLEACRRFGVPYFCDATQWIGKLHGSGLGACDFLSGSAHKFGGPRGVGFLKCPERGRTVALLRGGSQEDGRRAGTENVPGVLSMLAAMERRESTLGSGEAAARLQWRFEVEQELRESLPGARIVGEQEERLWNTVMALMPEADCRHRWVVKLDKMGFAVSTGSACASGKEEASHVLKAMGLSAAESGRALRFSSGWETRKEDWEQLLEALQKVARTNRKR